MSATTLTQGPDAITRLKRLHKLLAAGRDVDGWIGADALAAGIAEIEALRAMVEAAPEAPAAVPAIGERWPGIDGVYAGLARGEDGQPDGHLILLDARPDVSLNHAEATAWADGLGDGARLPTHTESALLYASLREHIDPRRWYWTSSIELGGRAWYQDFRHGFQNAISPWRKGSAVAVRLIPVTAVRAAPEAPELDTQPVAPEMVDILGVRADGSSEIIGQAPMPATMKARELVLDRFGIIDEDAGDDGAMALWCCLDLLQWLDGQAAQPADVARLVEAMRNLLSSAERANEVALRESGMGLVDLNAIAQARAALAAKGGA